ncbi:unnamed protein product [Camellia sinensis]
MEIELGFSVSSAAISDEFEVDDGKKHIGRVVNGSRGCIMFFTKASGHVPLKILSIEDGTILKTFKHLFHQNKKVDFIEQFNEKLLVKQESENLQILDVRNSELTKVSKAEFMTPSAFIFLYENQLFLTFRNRMVAVWNVREELITSFEDHLLWHPDCNTNNIYITSDQDLIISYRNADSDDLLSERNGKSRSPELNFLWVGSKKFSSFELEPGMLNLYKTQCL